MGITSRALSTRLLLASALVLPAFLGLSAVMLDVAFKRSLLAGEQSRLNTHIYLLLGAAEFQDDALWLPEELTEPRFSQLNSGLYAFIYDSNGQIIWRSTSAALLAMTPHPGIRLIPGQSNFKPAQIQDQAFYRFDYDVAWETEQVGMKLYRFSVLHQQSAVRSELHAYRKQIGWLLGSVALLLLMTQTLIMHWGLRPLKTLAQNLHAVEQGRSSHLEGQYPKEIQPVTENLNRVLHSERAQRERYRNTLADLAHSLKTPLAVLRGSLSRQEEDLPKRVDEQVSRMDQIVSHQLQRAVVNNHQQGGQKIATVAVVNRLCDALKKVYFNKPVQVSLDASQDCEFYGAEPDLMEVLGNILENAFKYCHQNIDISLHKHHSMLHITIADDGPGIAQHLQQQILARGARADTIQPGQGIGLAVAADIISSYRGSLEIGQSAAGGAEFKLTLPTDHPTNI